MVRFKSHFKGWSRRRLSRFAAMNVLDDDDDFLYGGPPKEDALGGMHFVLIVELALTNVCSSKADYRVRATTSTNT